jgi:hypothetical protein
VDKHFKILNLKMIFIKIFLVNILLLVSIRTETIQNDFKVLENQDLNMTVSEPSLISSFYKPSRMQCASECSANPNCLSAVHDNSQGRLMNCFTYNRYFNTSELIPSSTGVVYEKKLSKNYF